MNSGVSRLCWHLKYPSVEYWVDAGNGDVAKRSIKKTSAMSPKARRDIEAWEKSHAGEIKRMLAEREAKRAAAWKKMLASGFKPTKRLPEKKRAAVKKR